MGGEAPYDPVASLYDRHWGHEFASFTQTAIETHLLARLYQGAAVLDLCCGTGLVLAYLEKRGLRVYGVDESANMLAIARRNAPRAHLVQSDMADFRTSQRFDAAVSFYNSLNHARSLKHLRNTLVNLRKHLHRGGLFLFDYVLPEAFENAWEWCEQVQEHDGVWTFDYTYDRSSGQATCLINQKDRIHQTCFQPEQVRQALTDSGLAILTEKAMPGTLPMGSRRLVLARKQ